MATQDHEPCDRPISEQDGIMGHQPNERGDAENGNQGNLSASACPSDRYSVTHLATAGDNAGISAQDGGGAVTTLRTSSAAPICVLTATEWRALCALRAQFRQDRDLFSEGELARLRFVRWLFQTGRLVP